MRKGQSKDDEYRDTPDYSGGEFPDRPGCGEKMKYSYFKSEFKCPNCGRVMDEADWDYEFDYDDPDNPPYGCEGCGNAWPSCKSTCPRMNID